jgi:hypothetical protein
LAFPIRFNRTGRATTVTALEITVVAELTRGFENPIAAFATGLPGYFTGPTVHCFDLTTGRTTIAVKPIVVVAILTSRCRNYAVTTENTSSALWWTGCTRFTLARARTTIVVSLISVVAFFLNLLASFDGAVAACQTRLSRDRTLPF